MTETVPSRDEFLPGERLPRIKGSGDHDWEPWSKTTLGRGRKCRDCGCEDDGYQQPCTELKDSKSNGMDRN